MTALVSITSLRTISGAHVTKVVLSCATGVPDTVFYRRVGNINQRVEANTTTSSSRVSLKFDLTPENEGYYHCEVDGEPSRNEVELVGKVHGKVYAIYRDHVSLETECFCEFSKRSNV